MNHRGAVGLVLLASTQYFVAEAIAVAAWDDPSYRWGGNHISDLGIADLSPLHTLMNASFIVQGLVLITAAILLRVAASVPLAVSGVGMILVGLVPGSAEATYGSLHGLGAGLAIIGGNLASATAGVTWLRTDQALGWFSLCCGVVGLVSLVLFTSGTYLGLGMGGMERFAVDPITVWTTTTGAVITWRGRTIHRRAGRPG